MPLQDPRDTFSLPALPIYCAMRFAIAAMALSDRSHPLLGARWVLRRCPSLHASRSGSGRDSSHIGIRAGVTGIVDSGGSRQAIGCRRCDRRGFLAELEFSRGWFYVSIPRGTALPLEIGLSRVQCETLFIRFCIFLFRFGCSIPLWIAGETRSQGDRLTERF